MLIIAAAASTHRFKMAAAAAQGHTRVARTHASVRTRGTARQRVHPRGRPRIKTRYAYTARARAVSATLPPHSHIRAAVRAHTHTHKYTPAREFFASRLFSLAARRTARHDQRIRHRRPARATRRRGLTARVPSAWQVPFARSARATERDTDDGGVGNTGRVNSVGR